MTQAQILKAAGCADTPAGRKKFYKMYPTKEAYEMACGGTMKYPGGGTITPPYQTGKNTIPPPAVAPQTGQTYYDPMQFQAAQTAYSDSLAKYNAGEAAWNRTKATGKVNTSGVVENTNPTTVPNYTAQGNAPVMRMNTWNPTAKQNVDIYRYAQPSEPIFDPNARPTPRFSNDSSFSKAGLKRGGSVFPQIQSADGFFSMGYENVPAPYQGGSFHMGGSPGEVFHAAAPFPKNGRQAYGRPTFGPQFIAQMGGNNKYIPNTFGPQSGASYQWPVAPNAPTGSMNFPGPGGSYDVTPKYSTAPGQQPARQMEMINPNRGYFRPDSSNVGSMQTGKTGGAADINQGPEYFTNKMNSFTNNLKNTALQANMKEMMNQHMMPDGSMMSNDMMNFGGTPEMFPYAMPYEYRDGGIYIKPSKRGTFTAAAKKRGESVQGFASKVMANKDNYSAAMVKKANFAKNAAGWNKQEGGEQDEIMQLIQAYAQQVGVEPEALMQKLQALPEAEQQEALQEIAQAVQGSAGVEEDMMQKGGATINPFAANSIGMYGDALNASRQNSDVVGALGNFIDAGATAQAGKYNQQMMQPQYTPQPTQQELLPPTAAYRKYGGILQGGGTDPYDIDPMNQSASWDKLMAAEKANYEKSAANLGITPQEMSDEERVKDRAENHGYYGPGQGFGYGQGYNYVPANYGYYKPAKIKFRNVRNSFNMYGQPGDYKQMLQNAPAQGASAEAKANFAQQLADAGVTKYKERRNWLTGQPTKYKLEWDYYRNPKTGEIRHTDPNAPGASQTPGLPAPGQTTPDQSASSTEQKPWRKMTDDEKTKEWYKRAHLPEGEIPEWDVPRRGTGFRNMLRNIGLWNAPTQGKIKKPSNFKGSKFTDDSAMALGGHYQEGGEYDLTDEQIQILREGGYDIEYLD